MYVIKVKDKDLYFNADEGMGEVICEIPLIMDKQQADFIISYSYNIYDIDGQNVYKTNDLEIREVEIKLK